MKANGNNQTTPVETAAPARNTNPGIIGPDVESFITKQEVGSRLRKPVRTIEDWMRRRMIPFYKIGQAVRFRWSEVQAHFAVNYRVTADGTGGHGAKMDLNTEGAEVAEKKEFQPRMTRMTQI